MKMLGIIPARGGSKGVPGKNIKMLGGKPLILHTLDAARESGCLDSIYVSTDSPGIRDVVVKAGYPCPELRPEVLADDSSMIIDVLKYVIDRMAAAGTPCEDVCLLQPTSPFRNARHIKEAVSLYQETGCDTLVSVVKVPHRFHPKKLMAEKDAYLNAIDPAGPLTRNISAEQLYGRNGPAILITRESLLKQGRLYGDRIIKYEMDFISSIDIDNEEEWTLAEKMIK